jgi:hypothetical protein
MATQIMKGAGLRPSEGPANPLWGPGEVYVCGDPECRSEVLVLKSPGKPPRRPSLPRCVCGSILESGGSVAPVTEDAGAPSRDASEERE